jgi:hypothetical protein
MLKQSMKLFLLIFNFFSNKPESLSIYIICVCLFIVLSTTYCVVVLSWVFFLLCTLCCQFLWVVIKTFILYFVLLLISFRIIKTLYFMNMTFIFKINLNYSFLSHLFHQYFRERKMIDYSAKAIYKQIIMFCK